MCPVHFIPRRFELHVLCQILLEFLMTGLGSVCFVYVKSNCWRYTWIVWTFFLSSVLKNIKIWFVEQTGSKECWDGLNPLAVLANWRILDLLYKSVQWSRRQLYQLLLRGRNTHEGNALLQKNLVMFHTEQLVWLEIKGQQGSWFHGCCQACQPERTWEPCKLSSGHTCCCCPHTKNYWIISQVYIKLDFFILQWWGK